MGRSYRPPPKVKLISQSSYKSYDFQGIYRITHLIVTEHIFLSLGILWKIMYYITKLKTFELYARSFLITMIDKTRIQLTSEAEIEQHRAVDNWGIERWISAFLRLAGGNY